jgi:glycosyltransferase involved in cell wall biosynthesis
MKYSITVVIPTYNGGLWISKALDSISAQTTLPDEIIIVDDASTDGTPQLIQEWNSQHHGIVRLIQRSQQSGGPGLPLDQGIDAAHGDYIILLEQDDQMIPHRVALTSELIAQYGYDNLLVAAVGCGMDNHMSFNLKDAEIVLSVISSSNALRRLALKNWTMTCSAFSFSKSLWKSVGGFGDNVKTCCDYLFAVKAAYYGPLLYCPVPMVVWHRHSQSLYSMSSRLKLAEDRVKLRCQLLKYIENHRAQYTIKKRLCLDMIACAYHARESGAPATSVRYGFKLFLMGDARGLCEIGKTFARLVCVWRR